MKRLSAAMLLFLWSGVCGSLAADTPASPAPAVVSVENAGLLFTDNQAGVSGVDAGYSLPLGDRTLWLFGDVFLLEVSAPSHHYVGGVSNCALLVPAGRGGAPLRHAAFLTDSRTGVARPVIPNAPGEDNKTRLWPYGGWVDTAHHRAYLYYANVFITGTNAFAFRILGHGLAYADISNPEKLLFTRLPVSPEKGVWWPETGPLFGAAVVTDPHPDSPYLYLVGVQERGGRKIGKMARVEKSRITEQSAYEYFAGGATSPHWSRTVADAADVEGLTDFPNELSVAYNAYLKGYLAVHSIGVDQRLRLSLALTPWGPYHTIGEIGAPHRAFENAFCYAGKEHPELAEGNGRILYVTYVDSQRYWLQLLKVTLRR